MKLFATMFAAAVVSFAALSASAAPASPLCGEDKDADDDESVRSTRLCGEDKDADDDESVRSTRLCGEDKDADDDES